jgi:hypothetical protein
MLATSIGAPRVAGARAPAPGSITIESIIGSPSGTFTQGDGDSRQPSATTDGRFVAFESDAANLVANDNNASTDVFLRDNLTNAITRVSAKLANGHETNDDSYDATIAADGSRVAYVSNADGITADDHNGGGDAYVYNVAAHTTVRASVASNYPGGNLDGNEDGIDYTTQAAISADGNWVAFTTDNGLSIADGNDDNDVYMRDLVHNTTIRLSGSRTGDPNGGGGSAAAPSSDGCETAFVSSATDLIAGDTNNQPDVYVYDRCGRSKVTTSTQKRVRVSVSPAGNQANGPSASPAISANGRYVVFASQATNLVSPTVTGGFWQIYLHDRDADGNGVFDEPGPGKTSTTLISSIGGAPANADATAPAISADGCVVAFGSAAANLNAAGVRQIFTVDRCHGNALQTITLGTGGATPNGPSDHPTFTGDGDQVMFDSDAQNLIANDTNGGLPATDVFSSLWRADTHAPLLSSSLVMIPSTSSVWILDTGSDNFKPSWSVWDPSGVTTYTIDLARYFWNQAGVGTAYTHFYSNTSASTGAFNASVSGTTYCMRVSSATDGSGNTATGAGPPACRSLPLKSTQLTYSSGWTQYSPSGAYAGVAYRTTAQGATTTRTYVAADRIAIVVTTCPTCGAVDVKLGGSLLKHVSLVSPTTVSPVVIPVATWSTLHSGTLTMTVTSSSLPVVVQGVGVYQDH